ncbi:MAG: AAA family ATPase [Acidobacteria bacterium]|nr:AAA family ATPase [Acidobacteriota bacterium]
MRVMRLTLENWRNFTSVDVPLEQRVFIAGPNAAGKSNLLDAFRFLRDITIPGGGLQKALLDRGGVSKVRCLAARRHPAVALDVRIGESSDDPESVWRYRLSIVQDNQRRPLIEEERVERGRRKLLVRPDDDDRDDRERLRQTHLEGVHTNKPFRLVHEFLHSIKYLHVLPPLVRQPERLAHRDLTGETFGSDFLEQIARSPTRVQQSRLRRIGDALRVAVPQLRDLRIEKDEVGFPHLEGRYEHWRPNAGWQREDQFSDGTLRLMALLWAVMDGAGPLLLEEPELNLHPAVVRFLPQMLYKATARSRRQVVVSTHSPDLLRDEGIASVETVLLFPHPNGTRASLAHDDQTIRSLLQDGQSMADAALPRTAPREAHQLAMFGD